MNPISNLVLYNCKLDRTMHKTIDFSSQSTRDSYFSSNNSIATIISIPYSGNAYFIRENKTVKVSINADLLDFNGVNYCRFNNPQSGTNNYFYCFIDEIEYAAPETSILHLRTDVMLTNVCNYTTSQCFVERQHIAKNDDVYYNQLTPESIDYGEIMTYSEHRTTQNLSARTITEFDNNYIICVCMSERLQNYPYTYDNYFGGVPNCTYYYAFDSTAIRSFFSEIDQHGQMDAVISVYPVPKSYINLTLLTTINNHDIYTVSDKIYSELSTYSISLNATHLPNGYQPRNSKLYCYPYNYVSLHNNNGSTIDLKYENTNDNSGRFDFISILSPLTNGSLITIPTNYKNYNNTYSVYYSEYLGNYDYAIEFNDFPEIPWKSNLYANYIALNKNSLESQKFNFITSGVSRLVNGLSGVTSAVGDMLNIESKYNDMMMQPDKIHGSFSSSVNFKAGSSGIFAARKCIKYQYAEKIDKYFDMYGYNISNVQYPNWSNRSHYNFVKTSGIDIYGGISKNDKQQIADIFDNGVTFWHISNGAVYGTYDTNNI